MFVISQLLQLSDGAVFTVMSLAAVLKAKSHQQLPASRMTPKTWLHSWSSHIPNFLAENIFFLTKIAE